MNEKLIKILVIAIVLTTLVAVTPVYASAGSLKDKGNEVINKEPTPSQLTNTSNLSDIANHWGQSNIKKIVSLGAISGYPDGTFKSNNTISYAEFLKIAMYSASTATPSANKGDHWASSVFVDAERLGVIKSGEAPQTKWDKPISRYEMTRIMTRLVENRGEKAVTTEGIQNIMPDYGEVMQEQAFKYYVEQAYMKGLIAGKTGGVFEGSANGTRAEAATMILRIVDSRERVEVDTSKPVAGIGQTLSWNNPDRPNAKEGDTFITPDGREVVLKVGPSGVLGEGQGVAVDYGRKFPNGKLLKDGDLGTKAMGHPDEKYSIDPVTGSGYFKNDWGKIFKYYHGEAIKIQNPKEGQRVGPWVVFYEGDWAWDGPSF